MAEILGKVLIGNGILDILLCLLPQAKQQLRGFFGHLLKGSPADLQELLLAQLAWGLIFHGAVRIYAGMAKDEGTRNRLGQLSYLFESLQFFSLMRTPGVDVSKVVVPAVAPLGGIFMIQKRENERRAGK